LGLAADFPSLLSPTLGLLKINIRAFPGGAQKLFNEEQ
jgi:hypothetical protein